MSEIRKPPKTDLPSLRRFIETIQRTGYDKAFRESFLQDPRGVLRAEGFPFSDDVELIVVIDEPKKIHLTVPVFDDRPVEIAEDDVLLNDRYAPRAD